MAAFAMRLKPIAIAVGAALAQYGADIRARRERAFRRAWNHSEKKG